MPYKIQKVIYISRSISIQMIIITIIIASTKSSGIKTIAYNVNMIINTTLSIKLYTIIFSILNSGLKEFKQN